MSSSNSAGADTACFAWATPLDCASSLAVNLRLMYFVPDLLSLPRQPTGTFVSGPPVPQRQATGTVAFGTGVSFGTGTVTSEDGGEGGSGGGVADGEQAHERAGRVPQRCSIM